MPRVRPAIRLSLVALGLAAAVYGTASLTGGWLGTPPWWKCKTHRDRLVEDRERESAYWRGREDYDRIWLLVRIPTSILPYEEFRPGAPDPPRLSDFEVPPRWKTSTWEARSWVGWLTAYAGYFLALGAWPGRRRLDTGP